MPPAGPRSTQPAYDPTLYDPYGNSIGPGGPPPGPAYIPTSSPLPPAPVPYVPAPVPSELYGGPASSPGYPSSNDPYAVQHYYPATGAPPTVSTVPDAFGASPGAYLAPLRPSPADAAHALRLEQRRQMEALHPELFTRQPWDGPWFGGGAADLYYAPRAATQVVSALAPEQQWSRSSGYRAVEDARVEHGRFEPPPPSLWDALWQWDLQSSPDRWAWDRTVGALPPPPYAPLPPAPGLSALNARNTGASPYMPDQPLPVPTWDTRSGYGSVEATRAGFGRPRGR